MATPTVWRSEFQVNTGAAATGLQSTNKVVALANGGFAVAWVEATSGSIGTSPGQDIIVKIYDAEGNVTVNAKRLNSQRVLDNENDFDLTATHDGFAMAYSDRDISTPERSDIVFERFDFSGNYIFGSFESIDSEIIGTDLLLNPRVTSNLFSTNDDVFVAYTDLVAGDFDVNGRIIDQSGVRSAEFDAGRNSIAGTFDRNSEVDVLSNGNFVTVFEEEDGSATSIEFRISSQSGASVTLVSVEADGRDPDVASLAGGGFVVAYGRDLNTSNQTTDIIARVYNNSGAFQQEIVVNAGGNVRNEARVTALPDGGFIVVWDDENNNNIFAIRYNADGTQNGLRFSVASYDTGVILSPEIATLGDGRVVFTWIEDGEIQASIWDPRDEPIDPDDYGTTSANIVTSEVITTDVTGSVVIAGTGAKTVLGQSGNDTITSSGSGEYRGGGGNDLMFSGLGSSETLNGGTGNDTLNTTSFNGNYLVNLTTGTTNFSPESFVSFENIVMGNGNNTIVGTSGSNRIISGSGDDIINEGGLGSDTVIAGAGNDLVFAVVGLEDYDGGLGDDTLNTETFTGDYVVSLTTGLTNFVGEVFRDFENIVSGIGNDTINGTAGANQISTGAGDDLINDIVNQGADMILAGDGDDTIRSTGFDTISGGDGRDDIIVSVFANSDVDGGNGADQLNFSGFLANISLNLNSGFTNRGGERFVNIENVVFSDGNDTLDGSADANEVRGRGGNDLLRTFDGDDLVFGGNGEDTINGGTGNDTLNGDLGNDTLFGLDGDDSMEGGGGNDLIIGNDGADIINGGDGADVLQGREGADVIDGGAGNDEVIGGDGNDVIDGFTGSDSLQGNGGNDTILGFDGDDRLFGQLGADSLLGEDGADSLFGGDGNDTVDGGAGNDEIFGGTGTDLLIGATGNDLIRGNQQNDTIQGNSGSDTLFGDDGFDLINGGADNDTLQGSNGNDTLFGDDGDDSVAGGNGADQLVGGLGADVLRGNAGNDTFIFNAVAESNATSIDVIAGIERVGLAGGDVIDLSAIDADITTGFDQAFSFLGAVSTSTALGFGAGALWVENAGAGQTRLHGLIDNDSVVDFEVLISDGVVLAGAYTSGDFIL
ncbi:MAG: calcium-binding protein [Pseudomonadota bacterium]